MPTCKLIFVIIIIFSRDLLLHFKSHTTFQKVYLPPSLYIWCLSEWTKRIRFDLRHRYKPDQWKHLGAPPPRARLASCCRCWSSSWHHLHLQQDDLYLKVQSSLLLWKIPKTNPLDPLWTIVIPPNHCKTRGSTLETCAQTSCGQFRAKESLFRTGFQIGIPFERQSDINMKRWNACLPSSKPIWNFPRNEPGSTFIFSQHTNLDHKKASCRSERPGGLLRI